MSAPLPLSKTLGAVIKEIRPNPGRQEQALASPADICFFGGGAGGGKTWVEVIDPARYAMEVQGFAGVIFRRTLPDIKNPGGLLDETKKFLPELGASLNISELTWSWPGKGKIKLAGCQYETDVHSWQGAQFAFLGFDEVTHFTEYQFFYLISRLRSTCGVHPYCRATCNPDPDSWVAGFISWWIGEDGFFIEERAGVLRWFGRQDDEIVWADSKEDLLLLGIDDAMSVTFIPSLVDDNPKGDKTYKSKLKSLSRVERERLLNGNWKIRPTAGMVFQASWFGVVKAVPAGVERVRFWDRAASEPTAEYPNPDWTVGLLLARDEEGRFYIEDEVRFRGRPAEVRRQILNTAQQDGEDVIIGLSQDPGQAGVSEVDGLIKMLAAFQIETMIESDDKYTRAKPASAQAEAGNVYIVEADWNEDHLKELEKFVDRKVVKKVGSNYKADRVDAFTGAMHIHTHKITPGLRRL